MKKILVVVDMQNDFIDGSVGTKEAQAIVSNVITKIKEFDGNMVIYTRDTHYSYYLNTQEGKKLPIKHCIIQSHGWEIPIEGLEAGCSKNPKECMVRFYDKSTFGCEQLAEDLRTLHHSDASEDMEIELIGLCTDICVVSNALLLRAYLPNVTIKVDSRCCAGVTPESHEAALLTMQMCQIDIL